MSRTAGYREIPQHLIDEAARRVGLEPEEVPEVVVRRYSGTAFYTRCPYCANGVVTIPRREHKSNVPRTLRHEMAHCKLGHDGFYVDMGDRRDRYAKARLDAEYELAAVKLGEGRVTLTDLDYCIGYALCTFATSQRWTVRMIWQEAKRLGVSKQTLRAYRRGGRKEETDA